MTTLRKRTRKTMQNITNLNEKCGDVRYCIQLDKRVYALHCLHCSQVCLQWDTFINHMEQEHGEDLYLDPVRQPEDDEMEIQIENDDKSKKSTLINDELNDSDHSAFDDLLESEDSSNPLCLQSSLKIENVDCSPNLTMFDYINTAEPKHTEADKNNSELSIAAEEKNINFHNIIQNCQNVATLQTDLNNSFSEGQQVIRAESVKVEGMVTKLSKVIEPMFLRLTNEITSMRQETNGLRNEIKELKKDKTEVNLVIPDNPFKIMGDFLNFEKLLLEDKNFLKSFEKELLTVAKTSNYTKNCWRKLLTDEVAEHLCWKGTAEKKSVRSLCSARAIRNAAISIGVEEEEFVKSTKSFFQFAKNRQESRKKYVGKTKTN